MSSACIYRSVFKETFLTHQNKCRLHCNNMNVYMYLCGGGMWRGRFQANTVLCHIYLEWGNMWLMVFEKAPENIFCANILNAHKPGNEEESTSRSGENFPFEVETRKYGPVMLLRKFYFHQRWECHCQKKSMLKRQHKRRICASRHYLRLFIGNVLKISFYWPPNPRCPQLGLFLESYGRKKANMYKPKEFMSGIVK